MSRSGYSDDYEPWHSLRLPCPLACMVPPLGQPQMVARASGLLRGGVEKMTSQIFKGIRRALRKRVAGSRITFTGEETDFGRYGVGINYWKASMTP